MIYYVFNSINISTLIIGSKSIERYREIEISSGINFYQEVGFLSIGPKREDVPLEKENYQRVKKMDNLVWPQNHEAIFQPKEAGHISPRMLVKAQKILARKNNCHIMEDALVTKIIKPDGTENGYFGITVKSKHSEKEVNNFAIFLKLMIDIPYHSY